jgi:hypothetical protein
MAPALRSEGGGVLPISASLFCTSSLLSIDVMGLLTSRLLRADGMGEGTGWFPALRAPRGTGKKRKSTQNTTRKRETR